MMMNPNMMMMGPGHFATGFESQTGSTVVNTRVAVRGSWHHYNA